MREGLTLIVRNDEDARRYARARLVPTELLERADLNVARRPSTAAASVRAGGRRCRACGARGATACHRAAAAAASGGEGGRRRGRGGGGGWAPRGQGAGGGHPRGGGIRPRGQRPGARPGGGGTRPKPPRRWQAAYRRALGAGSWRVRWPA